MDLKFSMTDGLIQRGKFGHRETHGPELQVTTEVKVGVMHLKLPR